MLTIFLILIDRIPCPDGMLILGWWLSSPQTEAKETLESVPIELHFYSTTVVFATLIDPPPPLPSSNVYVILYWVPSRRNAPTSLRPLPDRSCALVLPPSRAAPLDLLGAGGSRPVGGSETSLTACLRRVPANSWLSTPNSARPGALAPGVSLPDCDTGSTWKSLGGGGVPVEDAAPQWSCPWRYWYHSSLSDIDSILFVSQCWTVVLFLGRTYEFTSGMMISYLPYWNYAKMDVWFHQSFTIV